MGPLYVMVTRTCSPESDMWQNFIPAVASLPLPKDGRWRDQENELLIVQIEIGPMANFTHAVGSRGMREMAIPPGTSLSRVELRDVVHHSSSEVDGASDPDGPFLSCARSRSFSWSTTSYTISSVYPRLTEATRPSLPTITMCGSPSTPYWR